MSQAAPPGELGDVCHAHPLQTLTSSLRALRILLRYGGPMEELDRSIRTMFGAIAVLDVDLLSGAVVRVTPAGTRFSVRSERAVGGASGPRRPLAPAVDSDDGLRAWVVLVGHQGPSPWTPNPTRTRGGPLDARVVGFLPGLGVGRARVLEASVFDRVAYHPVEADPITVQESLFAALAGVS